MGICGVILLMNSPDSLRPGAKLRFCWKGLEPQTNDDMSGRGEVYLDDADRVRGIFYDMYGHVDFEGIRRALEPNISGHEPEYYRSEWAAYDT